MKDLIKKTKKLSVSEMKSVLGGAYYNADKACRGKYVGDFCTTENGSMGRCSLSGPPVTLICLEF